MWIYKNQINLDLNNIDNEDKDYINYIDFFKIYSIMNIEEKNNKLLIIL